MAKLPDKFSIAKPVVVDSVNGHPVRPVDVNGVALDDPNTQYSVAHPVIEVDATGTVLADSTRVFSMAKRVRISPSGTPIIVTSPIGVSTGGTLTGGSVTPLVYDNRFGTDTTTAAATGWFTFGLHAGNRRIWVDSISGNDANDGLTAATAKATLEAALTVFINASFLSADQLMIAGTGNRTYSDLGTGNLTTKGGISAAFPTAVLSYDPADAANTAKYGKLTGANMPIITRPAGGASWFSMTSRTGSTDFFAVQGIEFACADITQPVVSLSYTARHDGLVFQNCRFNRVQLSIDNASDASGYNQTGNVSKCSFFGEWATSTNAQGSYIAQTNNFILEDCVFAHCGWRIGSTREDTGANGGAGVFGHGNYFFAGNTNGTFRRVVYADNAADGLNLRGNCIANTIVSLDEPIAGNIGGFSGGVDEAPNGVVVTVDDWLIMGGSNINMPANPRAYAIANTNTLSGSYVRNVAAIDNPYFNAVNNAFINSYNGNNRTISSITFVGTTATLTTASPHNLLTGQHIYLTGASPAAYNVSNVAITVTSATTFTYTMLSTPATNATVVGSYTPQVPQTILVDKVHTYNYANPWGSIAGAVPSIITATYTNIISDALATGAGNLTSTVGTFAGYKTRDQIITTVITSMGLTPATDQYARKAQIINAMLWRPDISWAPAFVSVGLPSVNLIPLFGSATLPNFTSETPRVIYPTTLVDLTSSTLSFTRGTAATAILSGCSATPLLTSSDLPAGFTLSGRVLSYDGTGTGAATPTFHILETVDGTSVTHTTTLTLNIASGAATTLNPADASGATLTNGNLTTTFTPSGTFGGVRSLGGMTTGKHYWEATIGNDTNTNLMMGIADSTASLTALNTSTGGLHVALYYVNNNTVNFNGGSTVVGLGNPTTGTTMYAYDADAKKFWVGYNGTWWGNPSAGTGGQDVTGIGSTVYAIAQGDTPCAATYNFGATAYAFTPPTGFGNI